VTLTALVGLGCWLRADGQLSLQVKKVPSDRSNVIVSTSATEHYVGLLKNGSKSAILVQMIQMSGRYGGNGGFGACYLERWNAASRQWDYVPAPSAGVEPIEVRTITLKPRSTIEACRIDISEQRGEPGACYRFTLQVQAKGYPSPSVLSRSFKINGLPPASCGP
jgi:hypothetical protein